MNNPQSTYRIQLHKDFTLKDVEKIILYLHHLGIKTLYASPIFESTPGSMHGYDGLNPHSLNPEIGTEEELFNISARLKALGMQWVQDIVPNHMAFSAHNPWLYDVLEKGEKSVYASFFDVPWTGGFFTGKMMLPFLGENIDQAIDNGNLVIEFLNHHFVLKNFESSWPVRLRSYSHILEAGHGFHNQSVEQLLTQVREIRKIDDPAMYRETLHELQLQLSGLIKNDSTKGYIAHCIEEVNKDKALIKKIADEQVYQLVNWKKTESRINFRRFFTVNSLICLNMQNADVFNQYHTYIKYLIDHDVFQGLRIDHIDGLYDPALYLKQLRKLAGPKVYIVVEKILEPGEALPADWPLEGSSGYDFLAMANTIFTNKKSEQSFTSYYKQLVNDDRSITQQTYDSKAHILYNFMGGELQNLHNLFVSLSLADSSVLEKLPDGMLKETIARFLVQCPVYRYYGNSLPLGAMEEAAVKALLDSVLMHNPELSQGVQVLADVLLKGTQQGDEAHNSRALQFYQRIMQFTGPLMAKGVEDTLMYTYNRMIGHNEVGDSPALFGYETNDFHAKMKDRHIQWPVSMNATSTHDTKRGEDVRARLNVLTDLDEEWLAATAEWRIINAGLKTNDMPDANDEYFIYQTITGALPMPGTEDNFENRIQEYLQKALRESKRRSSYASPDETYENAAKTFAGKLLDTSTTFYKNFERLHKKIVDFGIINSLSQVVLKFTCPGIPDTYYGTELWDFSLVDPDNRRPVDFSIRQKLLDEIQQKSAGSLADFIKYLWGERYGGGIKLWLIKQLLKLINKNPLLFSEGEYIPLVAHGTYKENILAFARHYQHSWLVVVLPLHIAEVCNYDAANIMSADWKDTAIALPADMPPSFTEIYAQAGYACNGEMGVQDIFSNFPLCVFENKINV